MYSIDADSLHSSTLDKHIGTAISQLFRLASTKLHQTGKNKLLWRGTCTRSLTRSHTLTLAYTHIQTQTRTQSHTPTAAASALGGSCSCFE